MIQLATKNDTLCFYFSGHENFIDPSNNKHINNDNIFLPADYEKNIN